MKIVCKNCGKTIPLQGSALEAFNENGEIIITCGGQSHLLMDETGKTTHGWNSITCLEDYKDGEYVSYGEYAIYSCSPALILAKRFSA